jgi:hypothetical protein
MTLHCSAGVPTGDLCKALLCAIGKHQSRVGTPVLQRWGFDYFARGASKFLKFI